MDSGEFSIRPALGDFGSAVDERVEQFAKDYVIDRIWDHDPTVWNGDASTPELTNRLGWLRVHRETRDFAERLQRLGEEVRTTYDRVVLCGMGGSSLAAEVIHQLSQSPAAISFHMLDTTVPASVLNAGSKAASTLFVIASKSGTTIETACFLDHFWELTKYGGDQFIAITDRGSQLDETARARKFRAVFNPDATVGGRFSALSLFGAVPAALMGANVEALLGSAEVALQQAQRPMRDNVAARLGVVLGEMSRAGWYRAQIDLPPGASGFGLWLEQLVAESTGKQGVGVLPVLGRSMQGRNDDTLVVHHVVENQQPAAQSPNVTVNFGDFGSLGSWFMAWEFATAVAGAVLQVNPFDQPDVAAAKQVTNQLLERKGSGGETADLSADGLVGVLDKVVPGGYVAVLAYVAPSLEAEQRLRAAADAIEAKFGTTVTVGFGPRYLHSTGQLHKGGPPTGTFIQIFDPGTQDVPIPGRAFTFGELIRAQADGDLATLRARGRPVVRLNGLEGLERAIG